MNPTDHDLVATSSVNFQRKSDISELEHLASVQLYRLTTENLRNQSSQKANKRQKTEVSTLTSSSSAQIHGGVQSLEWLDANTLVAGCQDHAIKLIDVQNQNIVK